MPDQENLRPLEAVILKMRDDGLDLDDIASRIGKKPETVERFLDMIVHKAEIPEQKATEGSSKRPIERVVERLREEGESYEQIGDRLKKRSDQVERIETYSEIKDDI